MWRPPLNVSDRYHWAVGELVTRPTPIFRYFHGNEFLNHNDKKTEARLREAGFRGFPSFSWGPHEEPSYVQSVTEAFLRRLPPRRRSDFAEYLAHFRVRADLLLTDSALLALSGARLPSDGFYLLDPFDPATEIGEAIIEVMGLRHREVPSDCLVPETPLSFVAEPDNAWDSNAVRINCEGRTIGYVSRIQAPTIQRWLATRLLNAWVLRKIDGAAPRALVYVKVSPKVGREAAA